DRRPAARCRRRSPPGPRPPAPPPPAGGPRAATARCGWPPAAPPSTPTPASGTRRRRSAGCGPGRPRAPGRRRRGGGRSGPVGILGVCGGVGHASMSHVAAEPLSAPLAPAAAGDGVWAPGRRRLTTALVLTITLVAFESLAIATVMPVVADDLGGLSLYGWVFSGFFLGSLFGIVVAGRAADVRGVRAPFAAGLALFAGGLVGGGAAVAMPMLVAGRVAQGVGAGMIPAVAYTVVGRAYPAGLRPRLFAVISSAWVVPGLVGPAAASALAAWTSWRFVFLSL